MQSYPLFFYALMYWEKHFAFCEENPLVAARVSDWLSTPDCRYVSLFRRCAQLLIGTHMAGYTVKYKERSFGEPQTWSKGLPLGYLDSDQGIPPLHLALEYGDFPTVIALLLECGQDPNALFDTKGFISIALLKSRPRTVSMLLDRKDVHLSRLQSVSPFVETTGVAGGATTVHKSEDPTRGAVLNAYDQPLHYAMTDSVLLNPRSAEIILRILRDPRININEPGFEGETALHRFLLSYNTSRTQHHDIWTSLIFHPQIDLTIKSYAGEQPLVASFRRKKNESFALELLQELTSRGLQSGVRPDLLMSCEVLGWQTMLDKLLDQFPYLSATPMSDGHSPLTKYASLGQKSSLLRMLAKAPLDLSQRLSTGQWNLINLCAHQDWYDVVDILHARYAITSSHQDHWERTILHWAVDNEWTLQKGYEEIAATHLHTRDKDGRTALHIAAESRNVDAAAWLLRHNADFLIPDKHGKNAAHVAAEVFCRRIINMIFSYEVREYRRDQQGRSFLHFLVGWSDEEFVIQAVRRKRLLINVLDRNRRTPLHYAAMHNNFESACALLSLGSAVNLVDSNYFTALHYAIRNGSLKLVKLLKTYGADFGRTNLFGQLCWQIGIFPWKGKQSMMLYFLDQELRPAEIAHVDCFGRSLLHDLCRAMCSIKAQPGIHPNVWERACAVFHRLCHDGAYVNLPDRDGHSPLHTAVIAQSYEMVALLLEVPGVDTSPADNRSCSPLDWAFATENEGIIDLLVGRAATSTADEKGTKLLRERYTRAPEKEFPRSEDLRLAGLSPYSKSSLRPMRKTEDIIAQMIVDGLNRVYPNGADGRPSESQYEDDLERELRCYSPDICAAYWSLQTLKNRLRYLEQEWKKLGYRMYLARDQNGEKYRWAEG